MRKQSIACSLLLAVGLSVVAFTAIAADAPPPDGKAAFEEKCAMCHRQMGMGTGLLARRYPKGQEMLESRTTLPADLIKSAVRNGVGNMPRLSRAEVSDEDLTSIVRYLAKPAQ